MFNTGDMKQMQQPCLHLASLELPLGGWRGRNGG